MAPARSADLASIEDVVNLAINADSIEAITSDLAPTLRKLDKPGSNKSGMTGQQILSSTCQDGTDPLTILSFEKCSLAVLYILISRCASSTVDIPIMFEHLSNFVRQADLQQLKLASSLVLHLGQYLIQAAKYMGNPYLAIDPLRHLIWRRGPSHLTCLHPLFAYHCLQTHGHQDALDLLEVPIVDIDTEQSPPVTYRDYLLYHYYGGIIFAVAKRYGKAMEMLELAVSAPGSAVSMIQLDAYKKLILIQLIAHGKTSNLPKYTAPAVISTFKNNFSCYIDLANAFSNTASFDQVCQNSAEIFLQDNNLGLIAICRRRILSQNLIKLTEVYSSLSIADLTRHLNLPDTPEGYAEVEREVSKMIADGEIHAKLSPFADGSITVEFFDDPELYNDSTTIDHLNANVYNLARLSSTIKFYNDEIGRSKEFLQKALSAAASGPTSAAPFGMMDEDVTGIWDDEEEGGSFDNRPFA